MIKCKMENSEGVLHCVTISGDNQFIAASYDDKTVRVWRSDTCEPVLICHGQAAVMCMSFNKTGSLLVTSEFPPLGLAGIEHNTLEIWVLKNGTFDGAHDSRVCVGHTKRVMSVQVSPDDNKIASGSLDGTVMIWDIHSCHLLQTCACHAQQVWCVAWSSDSKLIVSGGDDGIVIVSDAETGTQTVGPLKGHENCVRSVYLKSHFVVSRSGEGVVIVWDIRDRDKVTMRRLQDDSTLHMLSAWLSPDNRYMATGYFEKFVVVKCVASGQDVRVLKGHSDSVSVVEWSRDGQYILSGGSDAVYLWAIDEQVHIGVLHTHICTCMLAPDARVYT